MLQENLSMVSINDTDWDAVQELIREVQRKQEQEKFMESLIEWDEAIKLFRKVEEKHMIFETPSTTDITRHSMILHLLLARGYFLQLHCAKFFPTELREYNFEKEHLDAYMEDLKQSLRESHHGFSSQEVDAVKEKIFMA